MNSHDLRIARVFPERALKPIHALTPNYPLGLNWGLSHEMANHEVI